MVLYVFWLILLRVIILSNNSITIMRFTVVYILYYYKITSGIEYVSLQKRGFSLKDHLDDKQLLSLYRGIFIIGDNASLKILYELERFGEKNFTELREQLGINPSTLSKKLRILTEVGIVSPDRTHDHLRVYYSVAKHQRPLKRLLDALERLSNDL